MFGFQDKTLDAEHSAKGTMREPIVWRPNFGAVQARHAR